MNATETAARWVTVTKDQFFAYVGPRDIVCRCEREYTVWETRDRVAVGRSEPGYASPYGTAKVWQLSPAASATLKP